MSVELIWSNMLLLNMGMHRLRKTMTAQIHVITYIRSVGMAETPAQLCP